MSRRRLITIVSVIVLAGLAITVYHNTTGREVVVSVDPYQNPQRFALLGHDIVGRTGMPNPPLGMVQTSMSRSFGEEFLVVYFKTPGFDLDDPTEKTRLKGEVKAWLELRDGLSALEVHALDGYEASYIVVPDYDLEQSQEVRLHIEGQGAHAAYTISGFGAELSRKESNGIGFSELVGPGDQYFKIECRAKRWLDKSKPASALTAFEIKLTTEHCEFIPFITAVNVWSDISVEGKNLILGGGRLGPGLVHSQKSVGIGRTGLALARSDKLYADIEYLLLYPKEAEEGVLRREGNDFVVRTANYELTIRKGAGSANAFDCVPRLNRPSNDYRFFIVEGLGPAPFFELIDPGTAPRELWNVDWSLADYVGKAVRLSLAEQSKPNEERFMAYVEDSEAQPFEFWSPKEPGPVSSLYLTSWH